jgi:hypothetical protein
MDRIGDGSVHAEGACVEHTEPHHEGRVRSRRLRYGV